MKCSFAKGVVYLPKRCAYHDSSFLIQIFHKLNPNTNSSGIKYTKDQALKESLHEHGVKVLSGVDEVLSNIDQPSLCFSLIRKTGAFHRRLQGFKPKYFKCFEEPFIAMVQNSLGHRFTPQMEIVYQSVATFFVQTLIEGYNGDIT